MDELMAAITPCARGRYTAPGYYARRGWEASITGASSAQYLMISADILTKQAPRAQALSRALTPGGAAMPSALH